MMIAEEQKERNYKYYYSDGVTKGLQQADAFRDAEKYYRLFKPDNPQDKKKKKPQPDNTDLTNVIDFHDIESNTEANLSNIITIEIPPSDSTHFQTVRKVYGLKSCPGFYFIPNTFSESQQKHWVKSCLKDYTVGNPTNISNLQGNTEYWNEWKSELVDQLRWATVGYHFQWAERQYRQEIHGDFPNDLYETIRDLAKLVDHDMSPEAATINFYNNAKQTMGGHLDDAEKDMSKPIVSCSFGNSVIFLMGGKTRDVPPVALYIKSGDCMIMSGDARCSYHGVCRVIADSCPDHLKKESENYDSHCTSFISKGRINMNCRQVFYKQ